MGSSRHPPQGRLAPRSSPETVQHMSLASKFHPRSLQTSRMTHPPRAQSHTWVYCLTGCGHIPFLGVCFNGTTEGALSQELFYQWGRHRLLTQSPRLKRKMTFLERQPEWTHPALRGDLGALVCLELCVTNSPAAAPTHQPPHRNSCYILRWLGVCPLGNSHSIYPPM